MIKEYIYIIKKNTDDNTGMIKCTSNFYNTMLTHMDVCNNMKLKFNDETYTIWKFDILSPEHTCKSIIKKIKWSSYTTHYPFKKINFENDAYIIDNINNLGNFLISNNIRFNYYNINISKAIDILGKWCVTNHYVINIKNINNDILLNNKKNIKWKNMIYAPILFFIFANILFFIIYSFISNTS
jgi:hypothetical protein